MRWLRSITAVAVGAGMVFAGTGAAYGCSPQVAPGTVSRPILSAAEAAPYNPENFFRFSGPYPAPVVDPWHPGDVRTGVRPDYLVGGNGFATVQAAVDAAYNAGGTRRKYILIRPGTYTGIVLIPAGAPPLTIYGTGRPEDVQLRLTIDATWSPAQWAAVVNPSGQYQEGDPAWDMYESCATKTSATVALCASVVWAQSTDFQVRGLTITNTLLDTVDKGTHQALALRTDADRTIVQHVRLIGRQDTFYVNANDPLTIARAYVKDSYIEGDTDFVFGRAATVFDNDEFHLVGSRKPSGGVIFAPNTAAHFTFGFLVRHSRITADETYLAAPTGHFGRSWDQGASTTGYLPGSTPNGQLVLRDSYEGPGFDTVNPWAPAATTGRPFSARVDAGRDLDDPHYNRMWEYGDLGESAT